VPLFNWCIFTQPKPQISCLYCLPYAINQLYCSMPRHSNSSPLALLPLGFMLAYTPHMATETGQGSWHWSSACSLQMGRHWFLELQKQKATQPLKHHKPIEEILKFPEEQSWHRSGTIFAQLDHMHDKIRRSSISLAKWKNNRQRPLRANKLAVTKY